MSQDSNNGPETYSNELPRKIASQSFPKLTIMIISVIVIAMILWGIGLYDRQNQSRKLVISNCRFNEGKFDITYPRFSGLNNKVALRNMNGFIQHIVDEFIENTKEDMGPSYISGRVSQMNYQVSLREGNLLSLKITAYVINGWLHPLSRLDGYTFDLTSGKLLRFKDQFSFDAKSRRLINKKIAQQIRERNISIFDPFEGVSNEPNYYLKKGRKMVIVFQEYEIAPYSSGILEFELPY